MTRHLLGAAALLGALLGAAAPAAYAQYCGGFDCPGVRDACRFVGGCPPEIAPCYGSPEVNFCIPPRTPS